MLRTLVLAAVLAGCNQLFDLDETEPYDPHGACSPLQLDENRYWSDANASGRAWSDTRDRCRLMGMDLVVFDVGDADELSSKLADAPAPFWTGVSYDGSTWVSVDGCKPALPWAPGEPSRAALGDCVAQTAAGMASVPCASSQLGTAGLAVLCETPRPSMNCRLLFEHSTYQLASTTPMLHADAEAACSALGMHLVEINSTSELDTIRTAIAPNVMPWWTGAQYLGPSWSSPTGCPQVFLWDGFPMLSAGTCVVYGGANGMQVQDCAAPAAVVCEANTTS